MMECDTCRAKPGAPTLCATCLYNRDEIDRLKTRCIQLEAALSDIDRLLRDCRITIDRAFDAPDPLELAANPSPLPAGD